MESAVVYTKNEDSLAAGRELGSRIAGALPGAPPQAVIVFASPRYDAATLLQAIEGECRPGALVGSS